MKYCEYRIGITHDKPGGHNILESYWKREGKSISRTPASSQDDKMVGMAMQMKNMIGVERLELKVTAEISKW